MNLIITIDGAPQTALAALLAHTVRAALSLGKTHSLRPHLHSIVVP